MADDGKAFGQTFMTDDVAEPSDISSVVKAVESFPTDRIEGDIVQLVKPLGGYKQGHFYKHHQDGETWIWQDLGDAIDLGFDDAVGTAEIDIISGYYPILDVKWTDPTDERWVRSELVLSDAETTGEQVLLQNFHRNMYTEGYRMTLPIPVEHITTNDATELKVPAAYEHAKVYIKTWWANGFCKYNELTLTTKD